MKNHLRLVASNDETPNEVKADPVRFPTERFFSFSSGALRFLRIPLFMVLLFLRVPVRFLSHLLVGPLIFFAIVWGFIAGLASAPVLALGGAGFILFVLSFAFDSLVLALAPEGYMMEL